MRKLIRYLMKPAHAGYQSYRRFGPYDPRYLAALRALEEGQAMCESLGRGTLPRTLRVQGIAPLWQVTGPVLRQMQGWKLRHRTAGSPTASPCAMSGTFPANRGADTGAAPGSPVLSAHGPTGPSPVGSGRSDRSGPAALTAPAYRPERPGPAAPAPSAPAAALARSAAELQGRGAGDVTARPGDQEAGAVPRRAEATADGPRDRAAPAVTADAVGALAPGVSGPRTVPSCDREPP
jgi:hypothetical protein